MTMDELEQAFSRILTTERVIIDFYEHLDECPVRGAGVISCILDDESECEFPLGTELLIVSRTAVVDYWSQYQELRVTMAVGGILEDEKPVGFRARYCFVELRYNEDLEFCTYDFYKRRRT